MSPVANWVHSDASHLSLKDKVKDLLKIRHKLVLIQVHELERLRNSNKLNEQVKYVENLYNHYIVQGLPKTYIQQ